MSLDNLKKNRMEEFGDYKNKNYKKIDLLSTACTAERREKSHYMTKNKGHKYTTTVLWIGNYYSSVTRPYLNIPL